LKTHLLKVLEARGDQNFSEDEIIWVITVPAIWDNNLKEFMLEAATEVSDLEIEVFNINFLKNLLFFKKLEVLEFTVFYSVTGYLKTHRETQ